MLIFLAFAFSMIFCSTVALCQDDGSMAAASSVVLALLPPNAVNTITIVFVALGAANAVSMILGKFAEKTATDKDDIAIGKVQKGIVIAQKFLNFFIAKK